MNKELLSNPLDFEDVRSSYVLTYFGLDWKLQINAIINSQTDACKGNLWHASITLVVVTQKRSH